MDNFKSDPHAQLQPGNNHINGEDPFPDCIYIGKVQ